MRLNLHYISVFERVPFIINCGVLHGLTPSEETLRKETKYSNLLVGVSIACLLPNRKDCS